MFILSVLLFSSYAVPSKILPLLPQVQQNASPANKQKQSCLVENSEIAQQPILSQIDIYIYEYIYIYKQTYSIQISGFRSHLGSRDGSNERHRHERNH